MRTAARRRRRGQGTVAVLVGLLMVSGLLRIGDGVGQALAVGASDEGTAPLAGAGPVCDGPIGPEAVIAALQEREERLTRRENQFEDRMQALRLAETEIEEKLRALAEAEASLAEMLNAADGAAEGDIARLTEVYQNMRPEDVAALFEQMDPNFSAGFVARMRPEAAAAIMTHLEPATAYSISVVIAARNVGVPTQ